MLCMEPRTRQGQGRAATVAVLLAIFLLFKCNFNVLYLTIASCKLLVANMKGTLSTFKLLDSLGQRGSELRLETVLLIDGVPDIQ